MKNVIKEFDVLMKKMRNLGFGLAANDLELAHKKALADQLNQVRRIVENLGYVNGSGGYSIDVVDIEKELDKLK